MLVRITCFSISSISRGTQVFLCKSLKAAATEMTKTKQWQAKTTKRDQQQKWSTT